MNTNVLYVVDDSPKKWESIKNLDLRCVSSRIKKENPEWDEYRCSSAIKGYRQFLYLVALKNITCSRLIPTKDMDKVWHAHILYTKKYADDCESIFGRFLHHKPNDGNPTKTVDAVVSFAERVFGEDSAWKNVALHARCDDECAPEEMCTECDDKEH